MPKTHRIESRATVDTPSSGGTPPGVIPEGFRDQVMAMERKAGSYGKGSRAISKSACESAIGFVREAIGQCADLPLPRVGPSVTGAVSLQWSFGTVHFLAQIA